MIGNYNDDVTDDVMYRDGTVVSPDEVTDQVVHAVGQSCKK